MVKTTIPDWRKRRVCSEARPAPALQSGSSRRRDVMVIAALLFQAAAFGLEAQSTASPDSANHLFQPVPREELRELNTDRPDKTESPYTVDSGHFQLELDLVSYTHDRDKTGGSDTQTDAFSLAPLNLKVGLLHNVDLQLILETYTHARVKDRVANTVEKMSGFGDVTTRLKLNLWGNDGGRTAFALMPFVKFPSNQDGLGNHSVEGGIILPLAVELPRGFGLGMMTEVDCLRNDTGSGEHASFVNSITVNHDLIGKLGGYLEFFSEVGTERNTSWVGTVDLGLTWGLTDNLQLDAGINIGVTPSADDFNPFVGLSVRF